MPNLKFTPEDADRILQIGDDFLSQWAEDAVQSGERDPDYEERNDEWNAIRPLFEAAPELFAALEYFFNIMHDYPSSVRKGYVKHAKDMARAALAKAKGGTAP